MSTLISRFPLFDHENHMILPKKTEQYGNYEVSVMDNGGVVIIDSMGNDLEMFGQTALFLLDFLTKNEELILNGMGFDKPSGPES